MHKHEQQTINVKHKNKGREMQTQNKTKTCYQRGNWRTWRKTSPRPSKSKSISWSTRIKKDPPSLIYPMYLNPLSYQWTSQSLSGFSNRPDCVRQTTLASFSKFPKLLKLQNTLYTLNRYGFCLGKNLLSRYDNGRGKEKKLQWFLTKDE